MEREIANAITGDRMEFVRSPLLGDGDMLEFRCTLPPLAIGAPLHVHDTMTESFEVIVGALEIDRGNGRKQTLQPGEKLVLAPGTPHAFRNPLRRETVFVTTASPGIELERFLRSLYGLANAGATYRSGAPRNSLAMAAVLARMDMPVVGLPRGLQKAGIRLLAHLARVLGTDTRIAALVASSDAGERQ